MTSESELSKSENLLHAAVWVQLQVEGAAGKRVCREDAEQLVDYLDTCGAYDINGNIEIRHGCIWEKREMTQFFPDLLS